MARATLLIPGDEGDGKPVKPTTPTDVKNLLRRLVTETGLSGIVHYCMPTLLLSALLQARAFAFAPSRKREVTNPGSILVLRLDRIGDLLLSSAMLRELRRLYPAAHITIIVAARTRSLVEDCPYVDEVLDLDLPSGPSSLGSLFADLKTVLAFCEANLRRRSWDLAIVPRWDTDVYFATLMCAYTHATRRIAFSQKASPAKRRSNWGFDHVYTDVLPPGPQKHEAERNLDMVRYLGGKILKTDLELWLAQSDHTFAESCWAGFGLKASARVIGFGVGANNARRMWPAARFAELIDRLECENGFSPLVVCGPGETDLGGDIQRYASTRILVLEGLSLRQTAALLSRCTLFIGNDSGQMHIAAAAGVPVIEISCHPVGGDPEHENSPDRFGPFTDRHVVIRPQHGRPPCERGCAFHQPHCITEVSAEQVAREASALLRGCLPSVLSV